MRFGRCSGVFREAVEQNGTARNGTEQPRRFFADFLAFRSIARRGLGFFPSEGGGKKPKNQPRRWSAGFANERCRRMERCSRAGQRNSEGKR